MKRMLSFVSILGLTATTGSAVISCYQKQETKVLLTNADWNLITNILEEGKTLKIDSSLTFEQILKTEDGVVINYLKSEIFLKFREIMLEKMSIDEIKSKIALFEEELIYVNYYNQNYDHSFSHITIDLKYTRDKEIKSHSIEINKTRWKTEDFNEIKKYMTVSLGEPKIIFDNDTEFHLEAPFLNIEWEDKNGNYRLNPK